MSQSDPYSSQLVKAGRDLFQILSIFLCLVVMWFSIWKHYQSRKCHCSGYKGLALQTDNLAFRQVMMTLDSSNVHSCEYPASGALSTSSPPKVRARKRPPFKSVILSSDVPNKLRTGNQCGVQRRNSAYIMFHTRAEVPAFAMQREAPISIPQALEEPKAMPPPLSLHNIFHKQFNHIDIAQTNNRPVAMKRVSRPRRPQRIIVRPLPRPAESRTTSLFLSLSPTSPTSPKTSPPKRLKLSPCSVIPDRLRNIAHQAGLQNVNHSLPTPPQP